ncbi:recombination and repair protein RecT [Clostridium liquoris]|jgi:recombination protein RecT|uniref:Recombination and repair protein RecT n=1 Tax=Clostridium liquoris TaxID=1289519 RepID=A0A2T0B1J5_9CLOT|nr:recombinase RecT [Clostridium liquoris]PRR77662.1 recombination and repair protein RecT [Clostridium liquoris]
MTTASELKNQLATRKETGVGSAGNTVKGLLESPAIKKRFEEVLKQRAPQYMSSIVNLVNGDANLKKCDQMSVIASCMVAATLDLPVDKNLGYAWVVPYGNKAQFQLGYKGYVQLALRTGQYKSINVIEIHEGELIEWNPLTEELRIDFEKKKSDAIIGYAGYFELINGFRKSTYWTKEQITKHKNKFSKSDFGWKKDFDAMAKKTVLRNMLSKWGILSIEMQNAYTADQETIKSEVLETGNIKENVEYVEADFDVDFEGTPFEEGVTNE